MLFFSLLSSCVLTVAGQKIIAVGVEAGAGVGLFVFGFVVGIIGCLLCRCCYHYIRDRNEVEKYDKCLVVQE